MKIYYILPLLLTTACATVFSDKSDTLAIHSDPAAKILVNGNQVGTGNAMYSLPRDKTAVITASKKGCNDMSVSTTQTINPATFLNTIFLGGYLIDAVTGSIHKASQTDYTVNPNCN